MLSVLAVLDPSAGQDEPPSLAAALECPDASKWLAACLEELSGLNECHAYLGPG